MINCRQTKLSGRHSLKASWLYLRAFPKIERHPLGELFGAASAGSAEFLSFTEDGRFIGLAYMIVRGKVAFLLYFAVAKGKRNRGCGSAMLKMIRERYEGMDVVLLIESLHEECDNMDMRIRRRNFYLRNGFRDTGLIQSSCGGAAIYDILNSNKEFSIEDYRYMLAHYPFTTTLEDIYKLK